MIMIMDGNQAKAKCIADNAVFFVVTELLVYVLHMACHQLIGWLL